MNGCPDPLWHRAGNPCKQPGNTGFRAAFFVDSHPLKFYFRSGPDGNDRKWGNMLRIGSGIARGRRLKTVTGAMRPTGGRVRGSLFDILSDRVVDGTVLDLCAGSGSLGIEALSRGARCCLFVDSDRRAVRMIRENLTLCGFGGPHGPHGPHGPNSRHGPHGPHGPNSQQGRQGPHGPNSRHGPHGPHGSNSRHDERLPLEGNRPDAEGRAWLTDAVQGLGHLADHACTVDLILADPPYGDPVGQEIVRTVGERSILAPGGILVLEHHGDDPVESCPGLELARRRNIGDTALSFFRPARPARPARTAWSGQSVPAAAVIRSESLPTELPPPSSRTRR